MPYTGGGKGGPAPCEGRQSIYFVDRQSSLFTNVPGEGHSVSTTTNTPNYSIMEIQCPHNDHKTMVTYMRTRTGPNWFRVYYKDSSCIRFTPKDVGRVFGIAKFTPSVNLIRDWCKEMVSKYEQPSTVGTDDDNSVSSVSDGEHEDVFVPPPMVT